ncbi:MAG TPA: response regulator [Micromonosporaceae bacterium]|nr:response regulator [Micromonosporaceae bacterium]
MIRVGVVDNDRMLIEGIHRWTADTADLRLVASAATVPDLLDPAPPELDVILLDLVLQDRSEPPANIRRCAASGRPVLVLSVWSGPELILDAFEAGAQGYVTKDHDLAALGEAIREVAGGGTAYSPELAHAMLADRRARRPVLSTQERSVLLAYASGMTLRAAARHVGIRPETAKTYLDRVKAKYQRVGRPAYTKIDLARRVEEDDLAWAPGPDLLSAARVLRPPPEAVDPHGGSLGEE